MANGITFADRWGSNDHTNMTIHGKPNLCFPPPPRLPPPGMRSGILSAHATIEIAWQDILKGVLRG